MLPSNGSCPLSFQALLGTDAQALLEGPQQDFLRKLVLSPQQSLLFMGTERRCGVGGCVSKSGSFGVSGCGRNGLMSPYQARSNWTFFGPIAHPFHLLPVSSLLGPEREAQCWQLCTQRGFLPLVRGA